MAPSLCSRAGGDGWGAQVIDAVVVAVIFMVITLVFGIGASSLRGESGVGTTAAVGAFVSFLLLYAVAATLYAPLLMAKTNGQTLGRMATGIRVVRTSGQPMTFGAAMLREVAVKGLLVGGVGLSITGGIAVLLNYLWPLWDEENRALHDFIVQTRVVRA